MSLVLVLGLGPCPTRPPAESNPLGNVVGQARPKGFPARLDQPAQAELPQAQFLFNPGIGKFGHRSPLPINLLGLRGLHLLPELLHRRRVHRAGQRTRRALRTTLRFEGTTLAGRGLGSVVVLDYPGAPHLPAGLQTLPGRTAVAILRRIVAESGRIELGGHAPLPQLADALLVLLPPGTDQIDPL